jgi:hypothetical protein
VVAATSASSGQDQSHLRFDQVPGAFESSSAEAQYKLNAWVLQNLLNTAEIESVSIRLSKPGTDIGLDDQIADSLLRTCNLTGASQRRLQGTQALQSV